MAAKKYNYNDFWEMRGYQSIWFTRNVSYRAGAIVALWASRIGVTPNMISVLSALITVLSTLLAIYIGQGNWLSGLVLIVGLQVGYAFDCADGPLARATGKGSSFGVLMDKISDLSSGMIFPCILAYGTGHYFFPFHPDKPDYTLRVLLLVLIIRVILSVFMWLKELVVYSANRLKEDPREATAWWRVKKAVSLYLDEPVYRLGISLAWILGLFWEFIIFYSMGTFLITIVYLASSKKEMDKMDLKEDRN